MSIITNAKAKATKGNMKEAFKNEEGGVDLASIMTGIIVIGLIGGVIAATVFAVIPWAQDNAAKQQLDSIAAAQAAYFSLSLDHYSSGRYDGAEIIVEDGDFILTPGQESARRTIGGETFSTGVSENLFKAPNDSEIAIGWWRAEGSIHYAAAAKSASGTIFYITDSNTKPQSKEITDAVPTLAVIQPLTVSS